MLLKELEHIGIPRIYDVEDDDNYLYIIEEFINGVTLEDYIRANDLEEIQVLDMVLQLCSILEYLHTSQREPIVYQDLKPDNILITSNMQVKLIDFGSARKKQGERKEKAKWITPEYAAPEVISNQTVDYLADIYSIGRIIEYIVQKNKTNLSHSSTFSSIIKGCLRKAPKDRFKNIKSITTILNNNISLLSDNNQIKTICIIGSQRRIGTTHCSLIIGKALKQSGYQVVMKESNENSSFDQLLERNKIMKEKDGLYQFGDLELLPASSEERMCKENPYVIISDCGELKDDLPSGDLYILVVGTREWELDNTERIISKFFQLNNLVIIFNLSKKEWFHTIEKALKGKKCFCMPYVQNPLRVERGTREKLVTMLGM